MPGSDHRHDTVLRVVPGAQDSPLVYDVSRSGRTYPTQFLPSAPFRDLHAKVSPSVEKLVLPGVAEGATVLIAQFPAAFVDPNRPIDDIDAELLDGDWGSPLNPLPGSLKSGSGLIHSLDARYRPMYDRKLTVEEVRHRIADYYQPYHRALSELLEQRRRNFGVAVQVSCHSMSSVGPRDGVERPQICIGDLDATTADPAYVDAVGEVFRSHGFEVAYNKPFRGNELLRQHAAPEAGIHAVQVEVRRDLYLEERTRVLHEGSVVLQACFAQLAARVRLG